MRMPETNSRGMLILQTLRARPLTIYQAIELHGEFVTRRAPQGIEHSKIVEIYCDLIERGCVAREGLMYRLTLAARIRLEKTAAGSALGEIVPPRTRDIWSKNLSGYGQRLIAPCRR